MAGARNGSAISDSKATAGKHHMVRCGEGTSVTECCGGASPRDATSGSPSPLGQDPCQSVWELLSGWLGTISVRESSGLNCMCKLGTTSVR
jgi:hypothetical protein